MSHTPSNAWALQDADKPVDDKLAFMKANNHASGRLIGIGVLLLRLEFVMVLTLGFYMVALGFTHDKDWLPYLSVTGFAFTGSAALFSLAYGFKNGKRWANSPAILANLIALGVAKYQYEAGAYWLAVPISTVAIAIVFIILSTIKRSVYPQ